MLRGGRQTDPLLRLFAGRGRRVDAGRLLPVQLRRPPAPAAAATSPARLRALRLDRGDAPV